MFAAQLAKAYGAYVITTPRPGDDDAHLCAPGARASAGFTGDVPMVVIALRRGGIHAVVHLAGDGLELADLLMPGAARLPRQACRMISPGAPSRPRRSGRCPPPRSSGGWPPTWWMAS